MEEKQSRIRWDDVELGRLAAVMAPRLLTDPGLHPLEAVRAAQECLEPARRRELKAWSLVEGRLQPKLDEAMARLRVPSMPPGAEGSTPPADSQVPSAGGPVDIADADVTASHAVGAQAAGRGRADASGLSDTQSESVRAQGSGEAAAAPEPAEAPGQGLDLFGHWPAAQGPLAADATARVPGDSGERAATARSATGSARPVRTPASAALDPAMIEAALVAALQSPAVEDALVELFARTMSKALLRAGTGELRPFSGQPPRPSPVRRVLLAGFPEAQQEALREALGARFEVRSWKPVHGPQLFQTLARLCRTVVFPEEADDEVDASLKDMDVRVIRHVGNASRLIERIEASG